MAIARENNIPAAVIYEWMLQATDIYSQEQKHRHRKREGLWWIRKSVDGFCKKHPYLTPHQVRTGLAKLVANRLLREEQVVEAGDQTKEYAVVINIKRHADVRKFSTEHALKFGLVEALILHNFQHWIYLNRVNRLPQYEGRQWHYVSPSRLASLLPASKETIHRALANLVKQGVLLKADRDHDRRRRIPSWAFVNESEFVKPYTESMAAIEANFDGIKTAGGDVRNANGYAGFAIGDLNNQTENSTNRKNDGPIVIVSESNSSQGIVDVAAAPIEKIIEAHSQPPIGGVRAGGALLGCDEKVNSAEGATTPQAHAVWTKEKETESSVGKSFTEAHELVFGFSPETALGRASDVMERAHGMNISARLFILALLLDHKEDFAQKPFRVSFLYTQQAVNRVSALKRVCKINHACFDAIGVLQAFGHKPSHPVIKYFLSRDGTEPEHEMFARLPRPQKWLPGQEVLRSWAALYESFFKEPYSQAPGDYQWSIKLPQSTYEIKYLLSVAYRAWQAGDFRATTLCLFGEHQSALREQYS